MKEVSSQEFRELVKALHPDANGGDHSRVVELTKLVVRRKKKKRYCLMCGVRTLGLRCRLHYNTKRHYRKSLALRGARTS